MTQDPRPPSGPAAPGRWAAGRGVGGDRRSLRLAAILLIGGELVYAVAQAFHPDAIDQIAAFRVYAGSRWWTLVHSAQFAASAIGTFGILALAYGLNVNSGIRGLVNRFAVAAAVAGLALNGVLYAVDGVALKQAVDAWVSSSAATQTTFFAVVEGIRGVEWGLRGYVDFVSGLTLILLAAVIVATGRVSRVIGLLMGLAGLAYIAQGVGYGGGYTAVSEHFVLASRSYQVLVLAWTVWLLVCTWRMKEPDAAAVG